MDQVSRRTSIISGHLRQSPGDHRIAGLDPSPCLNYSPPADKPLFDTNELRRLMDGHDLETRDRLFRLIEESSLFCPRSRGGSRVFVAPDYNQTKEEQREMTVRRIEYLSRNGVFEGWMTEPGEAAEARKMAMNEVFGLYDHSLAIKLGVHFFLW